MSGARTQPLVAMLESGLGISEREPRREDFPDGDDGEDEFRFRWRDWAGEYPWLANRSKMEVYP